MDSTMSDQGTKPDNNNLNEAIDGAPEHTNLNDHQQMMDFILTLEENIFAEDMLFMYKTESENNQKPIGKYHEVYDVANAFHFVMKQTNNEKVAANCFCHMKPIIKVITDLLESQRYIPDDDNAIENWRKIMTQVLSAAKAFWLFFRSVKNNNCVQIAEKIQHLYQIEYRYDENQVIPIANNHKVYDVAIDFITELKRPISAKASGDCFNHLNPIIEVVYALLNIQNDISDDEGSIENWQNILEQTLLVAKCFFIFFKHVKNPRCIQIAKSLLDFAFKVDFTPKLESKIFSVLQELNTFLLSTQPILSLESSTGSGKTRCVPFFLSIRSYQENLTRPFIIMTQPSRNIIDSKVDDFKNILKNVRILTNVDQILQACQITQVNQPILCLLTPFYSLLLIKKATTMGIDLFSRARWILDEVHDRTIFIDTIIGFLHQELEKIDNFPCQITLMTATMDHSILKSLGKESKNISLPSYSPYPVIEKRVTLDRRVSKIPSIVVNCLFDILADIRSGTFELGHILIFVAGNADCQTILREIREKVEMTNKDSQKKNVKKIILIHVPIDEKSTVQSVYQDIEKEAYNPNHIYIVPIQLAGYVNQVQKTVAQNPLPRNLRNVIKIIVSTNIVESSITILDLAAVIDSGFYNQAKFDPKTEITKITKEPISEKMAIQRKGRIGRTRKGIYVGLSIGDYQRIEPQMKTTDLSASLLSLRTIDIRLENVQHLPDNPDPVQLETNLDALVNIGALDIERNITQRGKDICNISNDFSPFFAAALLDIREMTNNEYLEILAALVILIMTSQQLVSHQDCPHLQKNYDKSSDIITLLRTFNDLFKEKYQDQKQNCYKYGIGQVGYSQLITSFSNFIHKIFKRESEDHDFLGRHFREIRKIISSIDLMNFINMVIMHIQKNKPDWVSNRTFSFAGASDLYNGPSIIGQNQDSLEVIVSSRPGWKGLECDNKFYVFSLVTRNKTTFGTIVHKSPEKNSFPLYKCISFKFEENISIPFFHDMLKRLNSMKLFLPMNVKQTKQIPRLTTLIHQSEWQDSHYLSICTTSENSIPIMKDLIQRVKSIMPFVGKSVLVDYPEVGACIEIFSIGGSQYSSRIHTLNDHPYAYQYNEGMFNYLYEHRSDLAKTDAPLRIAMDISNVINPIDSDEINPFVIISNNQIWDFREMDWANLIKPQSQDLAKSFINEMNLVAPNIINVSEGPGSFYCVQTNHRSVLDTINHIIQANVKDDILVRKIELPKIVYGEDIDCNPYDQKRISEAIKENRTKIRNIHQAHDKYLANKEKYEEDKRRYPLLKKEYDAKIKKYEQNVKAKARAEKPKKPSQPKEPKQPNFRKDNAIIQKCYQTINELDEKLQLINVSLEQRESLIRNVFSPLIGYRFGLRNRNSMLKVTSCGTQGCVVTIDKSSITHGSFGIWKYEFIHHYEITITHHFFHSMSSDQFKEIIKRVGDKFGAFIKKIENYCPLNSFGHLGSIKVEMMGKKLVLPFIKTVLNELEKGGNSKSSHEFELSNTIISNCAITHPANKEYFIKLMRKNKIDVTLEGSIIKGSLNEVRNAYQLVSQRRIELLFPFLSIKIPKCIFAGKIDWAIANANSSRPPNKHWVKIEAELIFPREDLRECQKIIKVLANRKTNIHGCLFFCDDPQISKVYLPVYRDNQTPELRPFCMNCLKETLHYATNNFFDRRMHTYSKEFLENNVEMIPPISICEDNDSNNTNETWPIVALAQLLNVLQCDPELSAMSKAWYKGVIEQAIRTCPSIITCCPEHQQKKFLITNKPINCTVESCKLCFCVSCKSWHDPSDVCDESILDKFCKRCPKCGTPTIKSTGCNHIQCNCGAHWCYKCGAGPFTQGSECYALMAEKHNSFVD